MSMLDHYNATKHTKAANVMNLLEQGKSLRDIMAIPGTWTPEALMRYRRDYPGWEAEFKKLVFVSSRVSKAAKLRAIAENRTHCIKGHDLAVHGRSYKTTEGNRRHWRNLRCMKCHAEHTASGGIVKPHLVELAKQKLRDPAVSISDLVKGGNGSTTYIMPHYTLMAAARTDADLMTLIRLRQDDKMATATPKIVAAKEIKKLALVPILKAKLIEGKKPVETFAKGMYTGDNPNFILPMATIRRFAAQDAELAGLIATNRLADRARNRDIRRNEAWTSDFHAIKAMVPRYLDDGARSDVAQSIVMALLEKKIARKNMAQHVKDFTRAHNRMHPGRYGPRSLDQPAFRDNPMPLIEAISTDQGLWA
jgi:hypothetical protein